MAFCYERDQISEPKHTVCKIAFSLSSDYKGAWKMEWGTRKFCMCLYNLFQSKHAPAHAPKGWSDCLLCPVQLWSRECLWPKPGPTKLSAYPCSCSRVGTEPFEIFTSTKYHFHWQINVHTHQHTQQSIFCIWNLMATLINGQHLARGWCFFLSYQVYVLKDLNL